jgi:uncharacterized phage-associated protein
LTLRWFVTDVAYPGAKVGGSILANNLHISYDLNSPGQNYEAVAERIRQLGPWAKVHESLWYVSSTYSAQQAAELVWASMDRTDTLYVADATNNVAYWYNLDKVVEGHIQSHWRKWSSRNWELIPHIKSRDMVSKSANGGGMAVSSISAARTLCELRDWKLSNLELQKLLYLSEMYNLGMYDQPLIDDDFEAWDYGPVVPSVYARARGYGSGPIPNVFHWVTSVPAGTRDYAMLKEISEQAKRFTAGQLVDITHWANGAWAKHYRSGERSIVIPKMDIRKEYLDRAAAQQAP